MLLVVPFSGRSTVAAQDADVDAFLRAVSDHFGLPASEVRVLSEWDLEPREVTTVLFLAREGGVSVDALVALKRGGRSWTQLAERYGLDAGDLHVPLAESASAGALAPVYERFRSTPSAEWSSITLTDEQLVQLVNVRVLSEYLNTPAARVIQAWERSGSLIGAYRELAGSGG